MSHAARYKTWGGTFGVEEFVFPNNRYAWWVLLSLKWLNICLPVGSSEWIPDFALLAYAALALPSKIPLPQPNTRVTVLLLCKFYPLSHWGLVSEWLCGTTQCCKLSVCATFHTLQIIWSLSVKFSQNILLGSAWTYIHIFFNNSLQKMIAIFL